MTKTRARMSFAAGLLAGALIGAGAVALLHRPSLGHSYRTARPFVLRSSEAGPTIELPVGTLVYSPRDLQDTDAMVWCGFLAVDFGDDRMAMDALRPVRQDVPLPSDLLAAGPPPGGKVRAGRGKEPR